MDDFGLEGGTQFDFTYAPGTSQEQIIGFEMAGQIWSSYLQDDVTVRIYVESTDELPEDVVGAALPGKKKKADLNNLRKKLTEDATSTDDSLALLNVPSSGNEFSIVVDGRELNKTKDFKFTNANAKALGLLNDERNKLDGYILVNDLTGQSTTGWDYDALRNGSAQGIDFVSVALHEIGHVLGFVSGIDDDGWLEVLTEAERKEKELKDDAFKFATPLDLFRYSNNDQTAAKIDLSTGGNPYFSLDGGNSSLADFSSGEYTDRGGDGYQASHWKNGSGTGVMNPILRAGERKNISDLDLKALDVIGWDLSASSLDLQQMYDNALSAAETAAVEDRAKDVEKLIKESEYDGRRSRGSSSGRAWQFGFWQFTTLEDVATEEIPEIVDSVEETTLDDAATEENPETVEPVAEDDLEPEDGATEDNSEPDNLGEENVATEENTEPVDSGAKADSEDVVAEEKPEAVESVIETDSGDVAIEVSPELVTPIVETDSGNVATESDSEPVNSPEETTLEDEVIEENTDLFGSIEETNLEDDFVPQQSDISGLEDVFNDDQQDPLLFGGLVEGA
ncbi:MAG: NF038122 family metalloprotease [Cyanobacteria bacterium P01_A01_bin.40]